MKSFSHFGVVLALVLLGSGCAPGVPPKDRPVASPDAVERAIQERLSAGDTLLPERIDAQNLPDDIDAAQLGSAYRLGTGNASVVFAFVLQKNMNTPLLGLPANVETAWGGVLASTDNGEHWSKLLAYDNPRVVRANPVGMFADSGTLYVDVADALGAGSGEGNLSRFALGADGAWTQTACYYYVQERYQPVSDEPLATSDNCLVSP